MAKQNIDIGSGEATGDGESLRSAFNKINENFTEVYNNVGSIDNKLGSLEVNGSTITTNDSSEITIDQQLRLTSDLIVGGSIIPDITLTYNLGSPEKQFVSLYVSNDTIYMGGTPLRVNGTNNTVVIGFGESANVLATEEFVNNTITNVNELVNGEHTFSLEDNGTLTLNGEPFNGGNGGAIQPYLELTNTPFIIQPVVLGSPVTVSTPGDGSGAQVEVVIDAGPVITSVTVTTPGTNYIVGQRYRVQYWEIGGNNDDSHIEFEVATVSSGGLLTVTDVAFTGEAAANTPGTYSNLGMQLRASPGDAIGPGLTLVRSYHRALFNIEAETQYDTNNDTSPLGTEWNSEGWGDLTGFNTRTYTTFYEALNGAVGNNIIGAELVMHDTINDQYYKFSFSNWGGNNGGSYAYTRTLVEDPNYFRKTDYGDEVDDVFIGDDDSTLQIGITRANNGGIYNPYTEENWDEDVSPQGTLWNIDGWNDLTDVAERTYDNLYAAFGEGGLGGKIVGTECIMSVPSINKYYAVKFLSWTQNNAGGGFSYTRREIDLDQLDEGVRFADGTVQKTAYVPTNVKLTAPGNRRIEEAHGYKAVSVTSRTTATAVTSTATLGNELATQFVTVGVSGTQLTALNALVSSGALYYFEVSLNQTNWFRANWGGSGNTGGSQYFQLNLINGITLPVAQGATVYYRITTGGDPVVWWDEDDLPGGSSNFRGAVIDYHAYTGDATIIGTIHIVDDNDEEHITHTEVSSGSDDSENDDLWLVQNEGTISYRRLDGDSATLRIQWTAKVFYGSEYYD
jgi:hypothetical protein